MSQRILRIRDPIHGYIGVTTIELELIDHPITQRLRWIAQSGMVQLVFPEVRTSRFTHSLGAMHLASKFFTSALSNSTTQTRAHLQKGFEAAIRARDQNLKLDDEDLVGVLHDEGLRSSTVVEPQYAAATLIVEQALRLAALFHDIGHLPFSHDFEYVVRDVVDADQSGTDEFDILVGSKPPHELIGYSMVELLQQDVYKSLMSQQLAAIVPATFGLVRDILNADVPSQLRSSDPRDSTLAILHELIDGEIDVDRTDYLLRDARAYGFDYVTFDLDRLIDNIAVAFDQQHGRPEVVIRPAGQTAAESFLFARFRMYQWGVFHHKVVQVGKALQYLTRGLLTGSTTGSGKFNRFLRHIAALADAKSDPKTRTVALEELPELDDVWWMSELRSAPDDPWKELILHRTKRPKSLWKRSTDFPGNLREFNRRLPRRGETDRADKWEKATRKIEKDHDVLVSRAILNPVRMSKGESRLRVVLDDGSLVPLSQLSPLIKSLDDTWAGDVQVFAFSPGPVADPKLGKTIVNKLVKALPARQAAP